MARSREDEFIRYYDLKIKEMQDITYGGSLRTLKGSLVESLWGKIAIGMGGLARW